MTARQSLKSLGPASATQAPVQRAPAPGADTSVRGRSSQFDRQHAAVRVGDGPGVQFDEDEAAAREEKLGGETARINTKSGNLHLRDAPSMDGKIIDKFGRGTVVTRHKKKGEWIEVKVWSGNGGKAGWMHGEYLAVEPGLTLEDEGDKKGQPKDYEYAEVTGKAFHGKPSAGEAAQGAIGDCYLIAAMGALASTAGGQKKLMEMVHPHGPSAEYTVTFHEEQWDGSYKPAKVKVSAWMPVSGGNLKYALMGKPAANLEKVPLWPAIIEKAYAQWKGGYEAIGGGGSPGGAMSEMAGVDVTNKSVSWFKTDKELTDAIKDNIDKGRSMTAATFSKVGHTKESAFSGSGKGPFSATLSNVVAERSVKITDKEGAAPAVGDDGKGKLTGKDVEGTVDYKKGKFSLTYKGDKAPAEAKDLLLECQVKYWLNRSPDIVGNHAYVVKGATDDAIDLHNPWGKYHPGKVDLKTFRKTYQSFASTAALGSGDA